MNNSAPAERPVGIKDIPALADAAEAQWRDDHTGYADGITVPNGCFPSYYVGHESWWYTTLQQSGPRDGLVPEVMVSMRHRDGGMKWEFGVEQVPGIGLRVTVLDDAWEAFAAVPAVFAALAAGKVGDLAQFVAVLDGLGFRDSTERKSPYRESQ